MIMERKRIVHIQIKKTAGIYQTTQAMHLWRNVSHLKVASSLSTFSPIAFGHCMKGDKLDLFTYWWAHVHQNLQNYIKEDKNLLI